ncbi:MAG TPA: chemotaxis protein CheD [Anaeromyxobacter sp.]
MTRASADPPLAVRAPDVGDRAHVYLHAGQLCVANTPTAITTVLGSCVAVCLYDPIAKVGGMNHFLLPLHVDREQSPRFGTVAVPQLVDAVLRAGATRGALVAKVFGGASVIFGMTRGRRLGEENAILALRLLEETRIPVLDKDVGGSRGRKLVFFADEGTAWVRQL